MVAAFRERDGASRRRLLVLEALLVASAGVALGVAARVVYLESLETTNLVWNLFLAWIPLVLALVVYDGARRGWTAGALATVGVAWLLFLPNAPYIVTDLKWLGRYDSGTHWFDPVLIGAAAGIGLVLGFLSLYLVQAVVVSVLTSSLTHQRYSVMVCACASVPASSAKRSALRFMAQWVCAATRMFTGRSPPGFVAGAILAARKCGLRGTAPGLKGEFVP